MPAPIASSCAGVRLATVLMVLSWLSKSAAALTAPTPKATPTPAPTIASFPMFLSAVPTPLWAIEPILPSSLLMPLRFLEAKSRAVTRIASSRSAISLAPADQRCRAPPPGSRRWSQPGSGRCAAWSAPRSGPSSGRCLPRDALAPRASSSGARRGAPRTGRGDRPGGSRQRSPRRSSVRSSPSATPPSRPRRWGLLQGSAGAPPSQCARGSDGVWVRLTPEAVDPLGERDKILEEFDRRLVDRNRDRNGRGGLLLVERGIDPQE